MNEEKLNDVFQKLLPVSTRIASKAKGLNGSFSIDPFTIMSICNCIISIVKLLYMCYSKSDIYAAITSTEKGVIQKFLLKREVRKNFKNKDDRKAIYDAFLEVSGELSEEDVNILLED
tara:strand:- start:86 stop:439 length:354 start_codon:yes stop_codon:yes gene_type:complete